MCVCVCAFFYLSDQCWHFWYSKMDKLRKDTCIWSNFYPSLLARSEIIKKPVQPSRIVVSGCSAIPDSGWGWWSGSQVGSTAESKRERHSKTKNREEEDWCGRWVELRIWMIVDAHRKKIISAIYSNNKTEKKKKDNKNKQINKNKRLEHHWICQFDAQSTSKPLLLLSIVSQAVISSVPFSCFYQRRLLSVAMITSVATFKDTDRLAIN